MVWGDIFEVYGVVKRTTITSEDQGEILKIDCTVSENYTYSNNITAFPIENGSNINDHIISTPISLNISGIVSDNPIELFTVVDRISNQIKKSKRPSKVAHEYLKRLERNGTPITINTSLDEYENMVMTSYTPNKSSLNANSLEFTATFQQIEFATTDTVDLPKEEVKNTVNKKKDQGNKQPKKAEAAVTEKAQQKKSVLAGAVDAGTELVGGIF